MEKLIFLWHETDGMSFSYIIPLPFEYESKDKFCFDILEKIKGLDENDYIKIFEQDFKDDCIKYRVYELKEIEQIVLTLNEWVEKESKKVKFSN